MDNFGHGQAKKGCGQPKCTTLPRVLTTTSGILYIDINRYITLNRFILIIKYRYISINWIKLDIYLNRYISFSILNRYISINRL